MPMRSSLLTTLFCLGLPLLADTVYPSADWRERPDPVASPYAVKGGTLRLNGGQGPKSYNAYTDNNTYTHMTFSLMYESLIGTDPETTEFVPNLAKRWRISDDGCVFTFEIDPDARWSDGRPVCAEDVKWTFDTVLDPASDAGAYQVILNNFHSPEIVTNENEKVHRTVRFRTKAKVRQWRSLLNCGSFEILPKHAFEGRRFTALDLVNAVVSGPYKLSNVKEEIEATFTRREDWWRAKRPAAQNVLNFDRIVMRYYSDNENAFEALKKRKIDVYPVYSAHLMANETRGTLFDRNWILVRRVKNQKPIGFQGFAMNMRKFPFDDLRVRKAMAYLLDRDTINRTLMFSEYFLMNSYFTDLWDRKNPCPNTQYMFDMAKAKALLAEAGWKMNGATGVLEKDGKPFVFTFLSRSPGEDKFLALYNAALKEVGIKMDITRKDFAGWMRDMDSFNFQMTWAAWSSSIFKNPESMWCSSQADHNGGNNITGFKDKEVDELIKTEKGEFSSAKRNEYYRRMDMIFASKVPYVLLWNIDATRILYWNKFGTPDTVLGKYGDESSAIQYWWYDADAARELEESMANKTYLPKVQRVVEFR